MRALIPFTPEDPKSRLAPVLDDDERRAFARATLGDVVEAVRDAGCDPTILATEPLDSPPAPVTVDERPLSAAVNAHLDVPIAVVMADLALVTPTAITQAIDLPGDVVLGPGRGGGTNLLVVRDRAFETDFHGMSIEDHRTIAADAGLVVAEIDSHRIATDIDRPDDLVEVLLHGSGRARDWLREHDIGMAATDGRMTVVRE